MAAIVIASCSVPLPRPGHPVKGINGDYRLPDFASCTAWGFSQEELEIMQDAALEWEKATNGKVSVRIENAPSLHCEIVPVKTCPLRGGYTHRSPLTIVIELDVKCSGANLKKLMMHELGHAFGLAHTASGIMMRDKFPEKACVDPVALREFCELHHCDLGVKTTCSET